MEDSFWVKTYNKKGEFVCMTNIEQSKKLDNSVVNIMSELDESILNLTIQNKKQ